MSRHTDYTDELADAICDLLAEGKSLVQVCDRGDMPHRSTVLRWLATRPDFVAKIAGAREAQGDFVHDEMAEIEAKTLAGKIPPDVARTVISSKQWRASKLAPRKYGDRTVVENVGTVTVQNTRKLDISTLSDEQLDTLEAVLRATVAQLDGPVIEHE